MAITQVVEIARAEVNDDYGVTLWQRGQAFGYSPDDARTLAAEMVAAANEADEAKDADENADKTLEQMRARLAAKSLRALDGVI